MPLLQLKPVLPGHLTPSKAYVEVMKKAALKSIKAAKRDLEASTRTWKHKPPFVLTEVETPAEYAAVTGTDDAIFGYVDQGTRPHIIRPRRSRYLRFRVGGRPKTRVGFIGSEPGAAGTDWRTAFFVLHPGVAKRDFIETIRKRRQITLEQEISQGIAKLARTAE